MGLVEEELVINGQKTGILALRLTGGEFQRGMSGQPDVPADNVCSVERISILNAAGRLNRMTASHSWQDMEKNLRDLTSLLEKVQVERSRIAFGAASVGIAETAKSQITALLEE